MRSCALKPDGKQEMGLGYLIWLSDFLSKSAFIHLIYKTLLESSRGKNKVSVTYIQSIRITWFG